MSFTSHPDVDIRFDKTIYKLWRLIMATPIPKNNVPVEKVNAPHWMQAKYVPTLMEGALEIGWMDKRNNYKDWESNENHPLTEDDFYWIADIALNEAYPCCWFPYTNKYLRGLKIEYIRIGEMRININDYHRIVTRRGGTKPYRGGM
jgi:hypothetical protein